MGTVGHADTIGGVNVVVPAANSTNVHNTANVPHIQIQQLPCIVQLLRFDPQIKIFGDHIAILKR